VFLFHFLHQFYPNICEKMYYMEVPLLKYTITDAKFTCSEVWPVEWTPALVVWQAVRGARAGEASHSLPPSGMIQVSSATLLAQLDFF
jgi:hypothetical protein